MQHIRAAAGVSFGSDPSRHAATTATSSQHTSLQHGPQQVQLPTRQGQRHPTMHILWRAPLAGRDPYTAGLITQRGKSAAKSLSSMALQRGRRSPLSPTLFGMFIDSLGRVMQAVPQRDAPTLATASRRSRLQTTLCSQAPQHRACSGFWRDSNALLSPSPATQEDQGACL